MRALTFVAVLGSLGCGTAEPRPVPVPLAGMMPAIDALLDAIAANHRQQLADALAEPIAVPLRTVAPIWKLAGAKGRIVGVDAQGNVSVWDAKSGRPMARLRAFVRNPEHIALSADGERLAICSGPNAEILSVDSGVERQLDTSGDITACGWLDDGGLALASTTAYVTFEAKTFARHEPIPIADAPTGAQDLGRGDKFHDWIATPRGLVDPETDKPVLAIPGVTKVVAFGDQLAAVRLDGSLALWTFGGMLLGHSDAVVSITARGDRLLTASHDGHAFVWKNATIHNAVPRDRFGLVGAGFLSDTRVALGSASGLVRIWDLEARAELAMHTYDDLACLVVQPEGRVAIATTHGIYETRDARLENPIALAASPCVPGLVVKDGERTATAHGDTIDLDGIRYGGTLGAVTAMQFAGDWLVAGFASGAIRLYAASQAAAVARACGLVRRFERADEAGTVCR